MELFHFRREWYCTVLYLIRSESFLILETYWLNIQNIQYFEIISFIFLFVGSSVREFYVFKLPEAEFDMAQHAISYCYQPTATAYRT
jgi:hypothetical protein